MDTIEKTVLTRPIVRVLEELDKWFLGQKFETLEASREHPVNAVSIGRVFKKDDIYADVACDLYTLIFINSLAKVLSAKEPLGPAPKIGPAMFVRNPDALPKGLKISEFFISPNGIVAYGLMGYDITKNEDIYRVGLEFVVSI